MFGLGGLEIFAIFVVILLVFGPKKIPALAKSLGKAKREFNEATSAFNDAINEAPEEPKKIEKKPEATTAPKAEEAPVSQDK